MPVRPCPSGREANIFQGNRAQQNDVVIILPNQTWVCYPIKANLLTPGCGEGKYSVYCRAKQGEQAAHAQKTHTPEHFQGRVFFKHLY